MKTIPFDINKVKIGTRVYSKIFGIGKVIEINKKDKFPVFVDFGQQSGNFDKEGKWQSNHTDYDISIINNYEIFLTIQEFEKIRNKFNKMIDERIKQLQNQ